MKRLTTHTQETLTKVANQLNPDCELTRKIVFSLHDSYGLRVLDEYVATYKISKESFIEKITKLLWLVIGWIVEAYNKIKR